MSSLTDGDERARIDLTSADPGHRDLIGFAEVNYEEAALVELELDGTDYRLDAGRQGTALCISTRPSGTYGWTFRGEARWQANVLRCKAFDRAVLGRLSEALCSQVRAAASNNSE